VVAKRALASISLALILVLVTGCGGEGDEPEPARVEVRKEEPRLLTFAQVTRLRFGTPRVKILRQFGPPLRRQRVRPYGVVATCYRYRAANDATGQIDPYTEFRLCYDRRDRLSLKSTAPPK